MSLEARMQILKTYLTACERRDIPAITACFGDTARLVDPLGERKGAGAIRGYFESIYKDLSALSFQTGPAYWCGASCAISWKGCGRRHDGSRVAYEGADVFTFDDDHRIRELWAFWAPDDLLASAKKDEAPHKSLSPLPNGNVP